MGSAARMFDSSVDPLRGSPGEEIDALFHW
jgi:hypothetical protein